MKLTTLQELSMKMGGGMRHKEIDEILQALGIAPGSPDDECIRGVDMGILPYPLRMRALRELT